MNGHRARRHTADIGFASNEILGLITHDPLADGALPR